MMVIASELRALTEAREDDIEYISFYIERHFLGQIRDPDPLLDVDDAFIDIKRVSYDLHQRSLARAITAEHSYPLARLDL